MKTIVYILSQGHSGSTLLDMIIGSHSKAHSIGERVLSNEKLDISRPCTCGAKNLNQCVFWSQVGEHIIFTGNNFNDLIIESNDLDVFCEQNDLFYSAILKFSRTSIVVDSAKSISRLRKLKKLDQFSVKPILLERNPMGVVASLLRRNRPWLKNTIMHALNSAAKRHFADHNTVLHVQYEKLVSKPVQEVERIMEYIGIQIEKEQLNWSINEFHLLGGNPMRFNPDPKLIVDERWKTELSWYQMLLIRLINNKIMDSLMKSFYGLYYKVKFVDRL